ncbi:Hypothetical predicted protein, partial [Paramuricea clavata]
CPREGCSNQSQFFVNVDTKDANLIFCREAFSAILEQRFEVVSLQYFNCTNIYWPGYSLLARRSAWCNGLTTSLSCGTLYARLGEGAGGGKMAWRCYCASALHPSKYAYNFKGGSSAYVDKHDELLAIN